MRLGSATLIGQPRAFGIRAELGDLILGAQPADVTSLFFERALLIESNEAFEDVVVR